MGLQVRIFRRSFSLKVTEGRLAGGDDVVGAGGWLGGFVVVEELVEVEVGADGEGEGRVTSHTIIVRSAGVGRSEELAFKDIAICIRGRRQTESITEVDASKRQERRPSSAGGSRCREAVQDRETSAD